MKRTRIAKRRRLPMAALAVVIFLPACVGAPPPGGDPSDKPGEGAVLTVCHGFGCHFTTSLPLDRSDERRFAGFFHGVRSAEAERRAISRAVRHFEERSTQIIGIRDEARSTSRQNGMRGQMDCIDESENTRGLLLHLAGRGLLKHHSVESNATRGMLIDGRYFHSTAVVSDSAGVRWAIDSWYDPAGGPPDIMKLDEWRQRGVRGER
jgi:hypothetical protein